MTTLHSLIVANVEAETSDAVTITFTIPDVLRSDYAFRPSQHLTLKTRLGGEELRRCYSVCRSRSSSEINVAVEVTDGGRFPRYVQQDIQQGMTLEVMVPQDHFGYQSQAEREAEYLAIAAGSGITSMVVTIEAMLTTEPVSRFTLIYGNHNSYGMIFRQTLADLRDRYLQRLQAVHLFSQRSTDSDLLQGRIDDDKLRMLGKNLLDFNRFNDAFIYGPSAMMDEAEVALRELDITGKSIHLRCFDTSETSVKRATGTQAEGRMVTLCQDGRDRLISLNTEDDNTPDVVLHQGTDLPFAYKGGVCATCECRAVSGGVVVVANYSLEADELAAGYVLSYQALLTNDDAVVDFDARGMAWANC